MIRLSDELINYPSIDLQALEERGGNIPDDIRNSIVLYNKALDNLRMNSEDIAIIELKKAISINPHFHEAMNLLGLCYSYIKEYSKAEEIFNKVIVAENNSVKALEYLKSLESGTGGNTYSSKSAKVVNKAKKEAAPTSNGKKNEKIFSPHFIMNGLSGKDGYKYGIGLLAGALLLFLFQLPFKADNKVTPVTAAVTTPAPTAESVNEFEIKYNKLNEEYQKLQSDLQQANAELSYFKTASRLTEVEQLSVARKYEEAADLLVLLRQVELQGTDKERANKLNEEILPRATWAVYLEGIKFYENQNYKDAAAKLVKVQTYGGDWEYMPDALYNLGRSYAGLNDKANALGAFNKLKEKYPSSEYAKYADYRISEIQTT